MTRWEERDDANVPRSAPKERARDLGHRAEKGTNEPKTILEEVKTEWEEIPF